MTHLYIELNTGLTEEVNSSIISKLYELAISGDLDETSDLKGRLHSSTAKDVHVTYLNTNFEDLYITVDKLYITFTDPEVERVLMATEHIGDGTGISLADCATYGDYTVHGEPYLIFKGNTTIEYFPEFKYFTYWINKINTTSLANNCFDGCTNLKNIDITGMTGIPNAGFAGCSLSEFNPQLLSGITHLGQFAFLNSGISGEINLPALQTISSNIFNICSNITKVLSLGTITDLKSYSFNKCTGLTQVALPTTCTMLRERAFNECTNLTTIYEEGSQAVAGSLVLSHISLLEGSVFSNTKITSADFTGCTFTSTGLNVFADCSNLTTVVLPNTCTQLGNSIFYRDTALLSVTGLNNVISILNNACNGCSNLTTVDIDWTKVTTVNLSAFRGCTNLPVLVLSIPNLTSIEDSAFYGCKNITTVSDLGTITTLSNNVFQGCSNLTSITFPTTLRTLNCNALIGTDISSIIGPEGVTKMSFGLHYNKNDNFAYVEVPSTVTDMVYFFHNCVPNQSLNTVICVIKATTPPALGYYNSNGGGVVYDSSSQNAAILSTNNGAKKFLGIYVPDASLNDYLAASNAWLEPEVQAKLKPISQLETDSPTYWAVYQSGLSNSQS